MAEALSVNPSCWPFFIWDWQPEPDWPVLKSGDGQEAVSLSYPCREPHPDWTGAEGCEPHKILKTPLSAIASIVASHQKALDLITTTIQLSLQSLIYAFPPRITLTMDSEAVKKAVIQQVLSESNMANARQLIEVNRSLLLLVVPGRSHH